MARFSEEKILEDETCFLILSTIKSETFLILRGTERNVVINVWRCSCQVPLLLSYFDENYISLDRFFGKSAKIKFHESRYSGSRVVPCGRTDLTTLIGAFRNYAKAPRN